MPAPVIAPANPGVSQLAGKWVLQIDTSSNPAAPTWVTIFGMSNFVPTIAFTSQDNTDYDSNGWGSDVQTLRKFQLTGTVGRKKYAAAEDVGQAFLRTNAEAAIPVYVRWFDRYFGTEAYSGLVSSTWEPQGGAVSDLDTVNFTMNGQGARVPLTNPMSTSVAPTVGTASPSGVAVGNLVTITGSGFTGATGVKFGAVSATVFNVQNDSTIVAVMPAGTAGSAPVTVINSTGTSNALLYTRGA
jgi:hypothetical protein